MRNGATVVLAFALSLSACGRAGFSPETNDPGSSTPGNTTPTPAPSSTPSSSVSGLDPSFGSMGRAQATSGSANRAAVDAAGRLLIAGEQPVGATTRATVIAFLHAGAVDNTFGTNGLASVSFGTGNSWANAVLPVGATIWMGGGNDGHQGNTHAVLASVSSNGSGPAVLDLNGSNASSEVMALAASASGFYVAINETVSPKQQSLAVERRDSLGALDPTFGTLGRATIAFGDVSLDLEDMAVTADGGVVLAATADDVATVLRLDVNGTPVGGNFPFTWSPSGDVRVLSDGISVAANGEILLSGERDDGQAFVLKLGNDGSLDPAFAATSLDFGSDADYASRAIELADGTVLVGATGSALGVLRLDAVARPVATWGTNGLIPLPFDAAMHAQQGSDLVADGMGGYLLVGTDKMSPDAFIAGRYLP